MGKKTYLSDISIEDLANSKPKKSWTPFDCLVEVTRIASLKFEKEKNIVTNRVLDEKALKKPMIYHDQKVKNEKGLGMNEKSKSIQKKKGGNKKKSEKWDGPEPAPDMPIPMRDFITRELEGLNIQLVVQKALYRTDCSQGHNRLSIPMALVRNKGFLREDESEFLMARDEKDACNHMKVLVVDPRGKVFKAAGFRRWEMKQSAPYFLTNPWKTIVEDNGFREDVVVQVWSFRVGSELGLAVVKVADGPPAVVDSGSGGRDESDMGFGASSSRHGGGNVGHENMEE